jgi:hypothetical protein
MSLLRSWGEQNWEKLLPTSILNFQQLSRGRILSQPEFVRGSPLDYLLCWSWRAERSLLGPPAILFA